MNKNLLLAGAVAVAGFFTLTAFAGKTLEQQKAEIDAAVESKVAMLRTQKQSDCDSRVMAAAQTKYDQVMQERMTAEAAKPGMKKGTTKKGPRVDPLPQPSKPTQTQPPSKSKWDPNGSGTQPSKEKWAPAQNNGTTPAPSPSKSKWDKSGGGN